MSTMQTGLFRNGAPQTSRDAARDIAPTAATLRGQVLAWLKKAGTHGATDIEMQDGLGMDPSTQRPRRVELVRAKLVADSGRKRVSEHTGKKCIVWCVTASKES